MSGPDDFDPFVERLFREAPAMPDAADFARRVEKRLTSGSRLRAVFITLAGLVGGVVAVRETLGANLNLSAEAAEVSAAAASVPENVRLVDAGVGALAAQAENAQQALGRFGIDFDFGSMAGMQMFWAVAALLVAVAVMAGMKLANEV